MNITKIYNKLVKYSNNEELKNEIALLSANDFESLLKFSLEKSLEFKSKKNIKNLFEFLFCCQNISNKSLINIKNFIIDQEIANDLQCFIDYSFYKMNFNDILLFEDWINFLQLFQINNIDIIRLLSYNHTLSKDCMNILYNTGIDIQSDISPIVLNSSFDENSLILLINDLNTGRNNCNKNLFHFLENFLLKEWNTESLWIIEDFINSMFSNVLYKKIDARYKKNFIKNLQSQKNYNNIANVILKNF